jgi:Na+-transporting NADH:ubiquinone oxidoreductase subunit F
MTEIVAGVVVFTIVVLALVALLLAAKRKLVPSGDVTITVNEDAAKALRVAAGDTLLSVLARHQIFVPSACGGKGSCGVCKVDVHEGGGSILPTETSFVSRGEQKRGCRLACQVKVKRNMKIEVAPEIFAVRKWECTVLGNRNVSTFIKELKLALPEGEDVPFRAGGYVQIQCPPHEISFREFDIDPEFREEWDRFDLWRFRSVVTERVAFAPDYREDIPPGKMSSWLFNLKPGDKVTVSGPYGEFFARDTDNEMCFVAAGAGMAPMRAHIFDQLLRLKSKRKMIFWYSARNLKESFYREDFDRLAAEHPNFQWHLVLSEPRPEDNWTGPVGLVRHNVLRDKYLKHHPAPEEIEYYLCGPKVMNDAVIKLAMEFGVDRENILLDDFG